MLSLFNLSVVTLSLCHFVTFPLSAQESKVFWFPSKTYDRAIAVIPLDNSDSQNPAARLLWAYFYCPKTHNTQRATHNSFPLVLITPILAGRNLWIEEQFAKALTQENLAACILIFPEQFERRYNLDLPSGKLYLGPPLERLKANLRQSQRDISALLEWIQKNPQKLSDRVSGNKIGILGISLGGIVGALEFAQEPRLAAGAFVVAGADCALILTESSLTKRFVKKLGFDYPLLSQKLAEFNLEKPSQHLPPTAYHLRPVFLIEAIWDRVIPKASRIKLKSAFPRAKVLKVPGGHVSAIIHIFWIKKRVAKFFARNLNAVQN